MLNLTGKPCYFLFNCLSCHFMVLYNIKSLIFKPLHLIFSGVFKVHTFCTDKCKCVESYISLRSDLVVQLTNRTAAKISWILVFCIHIFYFVINLLKIFIGNNCLSSEYKFSLVRNLKRYIFKYFRIVCNDLADHSVSSCDRLHKFSVLIGQNNSKSVQFPGDQSLLVSQELFQSFHFFCFIQGKHRTLMTFFWEFTEYFISNIHSRAICHSRAKFLL